MMLRCYANGYTGTTAFFRNRPLLDELTALLLAVRSRPRRVLFHACSVGAEPYSLALWWRRHAPPAEVDALEIDAVDVEAEFLAAARRAVYPVTILDGLTAEERGWFSAAADDVRVSEPARAMVRLLPPRSFVTAEATDDYDAILIMNALTYVSADEQRRAITGAARRARHVVGLTAFHPDTIEADVRAAGLAPWPGRQRAIHAAWGDRLVDGPVAPESPYYSFQLPRHFVDGADAAYRYTALFTPATGQAP